MFRIYRWAVPAAAAALVACQTVSGGGEQLSFDNLDIKPKTLNGILALPEGYSGPFPAVVLVHGTNGPDSRYSFHRPALLAAGIATFQVDFKSGVFTNAKDRPRNKTFDPFAYAALKALRGNPVIDPDRIAIMGFSLGGNLSARLVQESSRRPWLDKGEKGFAAHVAFYPSCKSLRVTRKVTGAPMLILAGEKDSYGDGKTCGPYADRMNNLIPGLVSLKIYPGVYHGFDRNKSGSGFDPAAENELSISKPNEAAAEDARQMAVDFLLNNIGQDSVKFELAQAPGNQLPNQASRQSPGKSGAGGGVPNPDAIIKMMDRDGDGKISRQEFRGPAERFAKFDADGDGAITENELAALAEKAAGGMKGGDQKRGGINPEKMLSQMDKDGDGVISASEFRGPAERFAKFDADGDGAITEMELAALAEKAAGGSKAKPGGQVFLNAEQIRERVIGNTLNFNAPQSGKNLFVYFSPDGSVELTAAKVEGEPQVNKWYINDNDMLCRTFGPENNKHCTRIAPTESTELLVMKNKKVQYQAIILNGRSLQP